MIGTIDLARKLALAIVLAVTAASSAANAVEAVSSAAAPIPASITQLEKLFRHLDKVDGLEFHAFEPSSGTSQRWECACC